MTTDQIKMEINIAGEKILLTVPFSRQIAVRNTERAVNALYDNWRQQFPDKSVKELLAMMAYQFASYYDQLRERVDAMRTEAIEIDEILDRLILRNDSGQHPAYPDHIIP